MKRPGLAPVEWLGLLACVLTALSLAVEACRLRHWFPALLLALLTGCNGSVDPGAHIVQQPSSNHTFLVTVQNNTQWVLDLGTATFVPTGQTGTLVIPPGDHATFYFGSVPSAVYMTASTTSLPAVNYPTQSQFLGRDYTNATLSISFGVP